MRVHVTVGGHMHAAERVESVEKQLTLEGHRRELWRSAAVSHVQVHRAGVCVGAVPLSRLA